MAPQQPNIPPPAKGMSPQQYYSFLTQKGVPGWAAYDAVQSTYGNQSNQNEGPDQANQWGQVAGLVGGNLIGSEIVRGFPNIGGLFGGGSGAGAAKLTTDASIAAPKIIGAKAVGGTATSGATTGASTLGSVGSVALPVALAVGTASNAWETGMKDILRGRGNREDWANQGINMATGFLPNMALRLMGKRSVGKMMTTGKSDAQLLRDDFRGDLKASGIADEDYNVTLADGSKFDIGKDGKAKLTNTDGQTTRRYYEVDENNPLAMYAISKIDPLIRAKYNQEAEAAGYKPEQFTAMMVNAVSSNAKSEKDIDANIDRIFNSQGEKAPAGQPGIGMQQKPAEYQPGQNAGQLAASISGQTPQQQAPSGPPIDTSDMQFYQNTLNRLRNQGR